MSGRGSADVAVAAIILGVILAVLVIGHSSDPRPKPVDPPRIASDCRAACTLEGMEFAGAEIIPDRYGTAATPSVRCLCAPSGSGGDL